MDSTTARRTVAEAVDVGGPVTTTRTFSGERRAKKSAVRRATSPSSRPRLIDVSSRSTEESPTTHVWSRGRWFSSVSTGIRYDRPAVGSL
ncbi:MULTISPECIES: hypothetical protein [unclassified Micromonospora]|uniref:hypothetical protein n=1 Tax=unclassified Micromonospora TaxID=2617518 RepID=UPI00362BFD16